MLRTLENYVASRLFEGIVVVMTNDRDPEVLMYKSTISSNVGFRSTLTQFKSQRANQYISYSDETD